MMSTGARDEPLGRYVERLDGARVRFTCMACGSCHDLDADHVVWLLKALGLGDEQTSVAGCAHLDDHACVRCGGTRWETAPSPAQAGALSPAAPRRG